MLDFGPEMKAAGLAGRLVSIQSLRRRGRFWRYALLLGGRATIAFLGLLGIAIGGSALAYWKFAHHHSWVIIPGALVAIVVLMEAAYHRWEQAEASRELAV